MQNASKKFATAASHRKSYNQGVHHEKTPSISFWRSIKRSPCRVIGEPPKLAGNLLIFKGFWVIGETTALTTFSMVSAIGHDVRNPTFKISRHEFMEKKTLKIKAPSKVSNRAFWLQIYSDLQVENMLTHELYNKEQKLGALLALQQKGVKTTNMVIR